MFGWVGQFLRGANSRIYGNITLTHTIDVQQLNLWGVRHPRTPCIYGSKFSKCQFTSYFIYLAKCEGSQINGKSKSG